jgi:hypothetical protein
LKEGTGLDEWEARIEQLGRVDGISRLKKMKKWTDQMAEVQDRISIGIAYQFDGNKLLPTIFSNRPCSFESNMVTLEPMNEFPPGAEGHCLWPWGLTERGGGKWVIR